MFLRFLFFLKFLHIFAILNHFVILGDNFIAETGVFKDTFPNIWGCDSVRVLHLTVVPPPSEEHINATICRGEVYDFVGEAITEPGEYRKVIPTGGKCDAVTVLHLQVLDPMGITIDMPSFVCADDKARWQTSYGNFTR